MTSVLIVDDHGLLADGLALALVAEGLRAAVHVPTSSQGIIEAVAGGRPEVVLLDLDLGLGRGSGVELVGPLVALGANVVVLTGSTSRLAHAACLEAGAAEVVSKGEPFDDLVEALRRTTRGEQAFGRRRREELLDELRRSRREHQRQLAPFERLTPREAAVLRELAAGASAKTIARSTFVSVATVRSQIRGVLTKLDVGSQVAAVALANQRGWLERPD